METSIEAAKLFPENVFSVPWKESDIVLVVQSTEFHVHRSILTLQSQVFKAMLNGDFKEASQEKITLEGKNCEDMLQFLKLFYPPNMIKEPLISFIGENVLKMLVLADEYQADDVMKQCFEEIKITRENAFKIRPYAVKYNESVFEQCNEVIKRSVAIKDIEKELPVLGNEVVKELLVAKCDFLQSIAVRANDLLQKMLELILEAKSSASTVKTFDHQLGNNDCCRHQVNVADFTKARICPHCLIAYRRGFIDNAMRGNRRSNHANILFDILIDCNDVSTGIE